MTNNRRLDLNSQRLNSGLVSSFKDKIIKVISLLESEGLKPLITQAFRSVAEQNSLYAIGRTKAGKIVTNARGGQSAHNFGKAVDFAFVNQIGDIIYSVDLYKKMAQVAKPLGLIWGGDWRSIKDYPHLETK